MAIYNSAHGIQSILNAALGDYQLKGFRLVENGDHFLLLYYRDGLLEVFNQSRATIPVIHTACREYLASLESLDAS